MIKVDSEYNPLAAILSLNSLSVGERNQEFYDLVQRELFLGGLHLENDEELTAAFNLLKEMDII